jgi:hypothetical protein
MLLYYHATPTFSTRGAHHKLIVLVSAPTQIDMIYWWWGELHATCTIDSTDSKNFHYEPLYC